MAQSQCRPCEPRPIEGDVGDRGNCRTAALGGHVARCEDCSHTQIAYNSCRNRHCPKCQAAAAKDWLAEREAELLPVPYYHMMFTLPAPISAIAYQNKAVIYDILFKASAEALLHDRGRPKAPRRPSRHHFRAAHLGLGDDASSACAHDRAGRWHRVGRIALGGAGRASSCRCACSRACSAGCFWRSSSQHTSSFSSSAITLPSPTHRRSPPIWHRCAEPNGSSTQSARSAGPEAVLAYLSRYTHRVAIANSRLIAFDDAGVTFKWKDYRAKGRERAKLMTLASDEFIRRFLIHVLPSGFHRIRHYGLFAGSKRADNITRARELLAVPKPQSQTAATDTADSNEPQTLSHPCPCCGGRMIIIEIFQRGCSPRTRPVSVIRIDTS